MEHGLKFAGFSRFSHLHLLLREVLRELRGDGKKTKRRGSPQHAALELVILSERPGHVVRSYLHMHVYYDVQLCTMSHSSILHELTVS